MKIFIIGKVRLADSKFADKLLKYAEQLEKQGDIVHLPSRDTDQMATGYEICTQNCSAIRNADEIHIFYDGKSQGIHFDMGCAFALNKKIVVIEDDKYGEGKSFQEMLKEWEDEQ